MISQASSQFPPIHFWFVRTGAIACLSCLSVLALSLHPHCFAYSQEQISQTPNSQSSPGAPQTPRAGADAASGARPVLNQGSEGESVSELQALLKLLGFYTGAVDGLYRENTSIAVAAFQRSAGLQSDGIVGSETWARLLPASPVASNTGNNVVTVTGATVTRTGALAMSANSATSNVTSLPATAGTNTAFPSPTALPTLSANPANSPSAPIASPQTAAPNASPVAPATPAATPVSPRTETTPTPATVDFPILRIG
ncbi:MAG: hypothetical protein HC772_11465, partial [Leptolyngbyaceae cyanobacterium CRU_2_3]|nr:hypothetical protein [Leptolyngbyaceae cyanobacterium CRU_2_3]